MKTRLQKAKDIKCDGVDPDNVDGYFVEGGNNTDPDPSGFNLTTTTAEEYVEFLAFEARNRGLSIGLKNGLEFADKVRSIMNWQVNEECSETLIDNDNPALGSECSKLQGFITDKKPVFHIEYPKGFPDTPVSPEDRKKRCFDPAAKGFSTILKDSLLGEPVDFCAP